MLLVHNVLCIVCFKLRFCNFWSVTTSIPKTSIPNSIPPQPMGTVLLWTSLHICANLSSAARVHRCVWGFSISFIGMWLSGICLFFSDYFTYHDPLWFRWCCWNSKLPSFFIAEQCFIMHMYDSSFPTSLLGIWVVCSFSISLLNQTFVSLHNWNNEQHFKRNFFEILFVLGTVLKIALVFY